MIGADAVMPQNATPAVGTTHPSAPIPLHGKPLGRLLRRPLGETGMSVFPLVLGAGEFGWHVTPATAHAILDTYRALGGNMVHTSDGDASGRSEHIVGQWLRARGTRDETVVAARVGGDPDHPGLGSVNLIRSVEATLGRLQTDRIDLLYLDAASDTETRLEDTLATAEWLVETGKVRAIGSYGHTAAQLVEARILSSAGYPRITVLDVPYNLLRRDELEGDRTLVTRAQSIAVTPSHALAHGFLSGAHRDRATVVRGVRGTQVSAAMNRRGQRVLRVLERVGADLSIPAAAVAIAWLLAQRAVTAPIVNAREPRQVEELVQGIGAQLTRSHLADISRSSQ